MRLRKAEFKRITFALFALIVALTFVQCIFVVGGTTVAEGESYRELVSDYFSFNAPTRIAACGDAFAVFDGGKVTVFSGNTRTTFETGVESCDKLALSTDGVFVLTGLSGNTPAPSILCFNLDGTSKTYETARELFRQLWDGRTGLRLIGLAMTQLDREGQQQLSLFDTLQGESQDERDHKADAAVDALREKFGADIIKRGGMLNSDIKVRKR